MSAINIKAVHLTATKSAAINLKIFNLRPIGLTSTGVTEVNLIASNVASIVFTAIILAPIKKESTAFTFTTLFLNQITSQQLKPKQFNLTLINFSTYFYTSTFTAIPLTAILVKK